VAGITEDQVQIIGSDEYMESDLFNDREKAAILWSEHVTLNTARSRDDVFEAVRKQFSEAEIVELTFASGYFNMRNRFNDSLQIPIEPHEGDGQIKQKTLSVNTDKLKNYLQYVLDNWPEEFPEPHPDE
jgi:hypothetical protein